MPHSDSDSKDLPSLRKHLRELRKQTHKPISRMRKADISSEIEKLKLAREETPYPAAVPSAPIKKSKAAVETVKQAKATEFPVVPEGGDLKKGRAKKDPAPEKKKSNKGKDMMEALMKLMESDDE